VSRAGSAVAAETDSRREPGARLESAERQEHRGLAGVRGAIELTRFPVPEEGDYAETDSEAGLLRAADLIGQLGDPFYARKLNALFREFEEIGCNERLGYETPADLADQYPRFFWSKVEPFIGSAIGYLQLTVEGRQWIANLYCNVFEIEHTRRSMGPDSGAPSARGASAPRAPAELVGSPGKRHEPSITS